MSWNQYQQTSRAYEDPAWTSGQTTNTAPTFPEIPGDFPYVNSFYTPASLPTTPAQPQQPYWPTPSLEARLNHNLTNHRPPSSSKRGRKVLKEPEVKQSTGLGLYAALDTPDQRKKTPKNTPANKLLGRTVSSPATYHTPYSATSPFGQRASGNPFTPPLANDQFQVPNTSIPTPQSVAMTQRRMSGHSQRPVMGPPETPSRGMIPQSPGLFPNIQFSPDLFTQQIMEAQNAPVYPQQRLFWDPSTATPLQNTPQNFHTPSAFPDDFGNSFNSNSTIVPPNFNATSHSMSYDLPNVSESMDTNFIDGSVFPAPFQASPRPFPPQPEDPTHFLSSPARRFGGEPQHSQLNQRRPIPDLPAYHHQIQESKREKELLARGRRKSRTSKRSGDDLVMKSVRRALSPGKSIRPSLARSATYSGLQLSARRSFSHLDNVSVDSSMSSRSIRQGRSSPLKQVRDNTRRASASARLKRVPSVSLAIDEHGVARTIMNSLPEDGVPMEEDDDDLTDRISSDDEFDGSIMYSFSGDTSSPPDSLPNLSRGDARDELRSHAYLSMGVDRVAKVAKITQPLDPRLGNFDPASTIRRSRTETFTSTNHDANGPVSAQQALRQLMQDRSQSTSSHASTSSMQFHSSPPMQAGQLPGFNGSPTTVTDPDLATPSTDADSLGSAGATRCVCNSISPDGNIMIQW